MKFNLDVIWSESGEQYEQIKHRLQSKPDQNSSEQICGWILMRKNGRWTFLTFIIDSYICPEVLV